MKYLRLIESLSHWIHYRWQICDQK